MAFTCFSGLSLVRFQWKRISCHFVGMPKGMCSGFASKGLVYLDGSTKWGFVWAWWKLGDFREQVDDEAEKVRWQLGYDCVYIFFLNLKYSVVQFDGLGWFAVQLRMTGHH